MAQPSSPQAVSRLSDLGRLDQEMLYYMHVHGPVFAAKLAKRLNRDLAAVRERLAWLKEQGLIKRVEGREVRYGLKKSNAVTKHRNHTYLGLTRAGKLLFRRADIHLEINLRPPWLQA